MKYIQNCHSSPAYLAPLVSLLLWPISPLVYNLGIMWRSSRRNKERLRNKAFGGHNIINDIRIKGFFSALPNQQQQRFLILAQASPRITFLSTWTKHHLFLLLSHSFWCADHVILSTDVDWLSVESVTAKIIVRWNPVHLSVKKTHVSSSSDLLLVLTYNPKLGLRIW
jgi:hypothetical protein